MERFKLIDWILLIVAATLGSYAIPHVAGTVYLISTATSIAGPEPLIITGGILFIAIMATITWWKMKKLRRTVPAQTYRSMAWVIGVYAILIAGFLSLRIF